MFPFLSYFWASFVFKLNEKSMFVQITRLAKMKIIANNVHDISPPKKALRGIPHISHHRYLFQAGALFCKGNAKFLAIFAILSQIYTLFGALFTGPKIYKYQVCKQIHVISSQKKRYSEAVD